MSKSDGRPSPEGRRPLRSILLIALAVVLGILFFQNLGEVRVNLLFWKVELPLFVILVIVAAIGLAIGWMIARFRR